eukprot:SAG11_NODE_9205_length_933_cov_1.299760_1_plen_100_part_01
MRLVATLAFALVLPSVAKGSRRRSSNNDCTGKGRCTQWHNLSGDAYAEYLGGHWSCKHGQTSIGLADTVVVTQDAFGREVTQIDVRSTPSSNDRVDCSRA